jgi:hypothetical protein
MLSSSIALAEPVPQQVVAGLGGMEHTSIFRESEQVALVEVAYQRAAGLEGLRRSLTFGGGLRFAFPISRTGFPLEGFIRADLRARVGPWEPMTGLELGVSRIAVLSRTITVPLEVIAREDPRQGPLYAGIHLAPLRFLVHGLVLSGPELLLGAVGPPFGATARVQVGVLKVEVSL